MKLVLIACCAWIGCIAGAACDPVVGEPTNLVRTAPDSEGWSAENDSIVRSYRIQKDVSPDSKVVLLLISASVSLVDQDLKGGARVNEVAFIYSEIKDKSGRLERWITAMSRDPYHDKRWQADWINLAEGGDSLRSVLRIDDSADINSLVSKYIKKVISSPGKRDHVISLVIFDKSFSDVFGKVWDDASMQELTK